MFSRKGVKGLVRSLSSIGTVSETIYENSELLRKMPERLITFVQPRLTTYRESRKTVH